MKGIYPRKESRNPVAMVRCDECGTILNRRLLHPKTYKPLTRFFCNFSCKAAFQRRAKPVSREWLEGKYVMEGLDCVQIGLMVGRDPKSVWNWLKDFQIPTRRRGSDPRQHFIKGQENQFQGKRHTEATKSRLRQIAIADGRIPFKRENGPPWKGRGGIGHPSWKGGLTPERQSFYSSDKWKEAVKSVWHRADARCERCGKHHNTEASRGKFHIHHIVSFMVRELRAEISNLVLLCGACHKFVHSKNNVNKELIGDTHHVGK